MATSSISTGLNPRQETAEPLLGIDAWLKLLMELNTMQVKAAMLML